MIDVTYVMATQAVPLTPPAGWVEAVVAPRAGITVIATTAPNARQLALSVVLGQAGIALIVALACWAMASPRAALSALLGGGISAAASLAMALLAFGGKAATSPQQAIRAFFVGEAAKVVVVIVLFVIVLKTMKVVPLAMLGTYIASFVVFWVALARSIQAPVTTRAEGMRPPDGERQDLSDL